MKWVVAGLIVLLLVLRQDVWNWSNDKLMFGFLPATLFSQACISISATCLWWFAVNFAWPVDPDAARVAAAAPPTDPTTDPTTDPVTTADSVMTAAPAGDAKGAN